jgi:hypothetical protein
VKTKIDLKRNIDRDKERKKKGKRKRERVTYVGRKINIERNKGAKKQRKKGREGQKEIISFGEIINNLSINNQPSDQIYISLHSLSSFFLQEISHKSVDLQS